MALTVRQLLAEPEHVAAAKDELRSFLEQT
jgi:hypothetical protein